MSMTHGHAQTNHLVWYVIIVCLCHHWKFFEYIMYELRCDDNFDFSALYCLWTGIYELTWTATFLVFRRCLCKQEVLRLSDGASYSAISIQKVGPTRTGKMDITHHDNQAQKHTHLSPLPEFSLGNLTTHDEVLVQRQQLWVCQKNPLSQSKIRRCVLS